MAIADIEAIEINAIKLPLKIGCLFMFSPCLHGTNSNLAHNTELTEKDIQNV
ncbi:hypothetical protein TOL_2361 [Thalassolituus oleivorans MIL-1]|uniref:Uncharacterized protein n=1 Tax=Thalassolituus oleivorans MIL-1 TaxID=1298593 RepID=M5DU48_9GAMM|nr:hypothetical protein TOL_2361 [Thalassolituus oleivorans MIL-1]